MKTIEEYTDYLFNCRCADDSFEPEGHEDHLETSWELFDVYSWADIYPVWERYLYTKCETPEDVINFVNLYIYYDAADQIVPEPIKFVSYLYFKVDVRKYWDEAGDMFDGLVINIFSNSGLVDIMNDPCYNPLKDERILSGVSDWKNGVA